MAARSLFFIFLLFSTHLQVQANQVHNADPETSSSPFTAALEMVQKQIGYDFQNSNLLIRAMTHSSYSSDNNRALAAAGFNLIRTAISLHYLEQDHEIVGKDLSRKISQLSGVVPCSQEGSRLGLESVVRISTGTNCTVAVVCGAYRALFGAVAVDSGNVDLASTLYRRNHADETELRAVSRETAQRGAIRVHYRTKRSKRRSLTARSSAAIACNKQRVPPKTLV